MPIMAYPNRFVSNRIYIPNRKVYGVSLRNKKHKKQMKAKKIELI